MYSLKHTARWLTALAVVGGLIGAADASANSTTCSYTPSTGLVQLQTTGGGSSQLELDGQTIKWFNTSGSGACTSRDGQVATTQNTTFMLMKGTQGVADDFIVSERGGRWIGPHGDIPTTVFTGSEDTLDIVGSELTDVIDITGGAGTGKQGGVLLNGIFHPPTVNVMTDPAVVRINGLGGNDIVNGLGGFSLSPTSMHLDLRGGLGDDSLTAGLRFGDRLQGNDGADHFNTKDGQPGDNVTGGNGVDIATVDPTDQTFGVETILH
jgi:hypothetical protein